MLSVSETTSRITEDATASNQRQKGERLFYGEAAKKNELEYELLKLSRRDIVSPSSHPPLRTLVAGFSFVSSVLSFRL